MVSSNGWPKNLFEHSKIVWQNCVDFLKTSYVKSCGDCAETVFLLQNVFWLYLTASSFCPQCTKLADWSSSFISFSFTCCKLNMSNDVTPHAPTVLHLPAFDSCFASSRNAQLPYPTSSSAPIRILYNKYSRLAPLCTILSYFRHVLIWYLMQYLPLISLVPLA